MELATQRCKENPLITSEYDVLYTTGPDCFTEVVSQDFNTAEIMHSTYDYMRHQGFHTWYHNQDK